MSILNRGIYDAAVKRNRIAGSFVALSVVGFGIFAAAIKVVQLHNTVAEFLHTTPYF